MSSKQRAERVPTPEARRRILAAADKLLRQGRYSELSVDELMGASGLTRTIFYRHFRSLPHVVLSLLDDLVATIEAMPVTGAATGPELLRRQLETVVATYQTHGAALLALEAAARDNVDVERDRRAWAERGVEVTVTLLERGVEGGRTPAMPVREVARALHAMNRSYLLDLVSADPDFDREMAVEALWTVWVRTTWIDQP